MKNANDYIESYKRFARSNPKASKEEKVNAIRTLFKHSLSEGYKHGVKNTIDNKELMKRPILEEEKLVFLISENPGLSDLINKFNLEIET